MRSFITGIAGFAGSHLADHLLSLGHEVSGLVLSTEQRGNLSSGRLNRGARHAAKTVQTRRIGGWILQKRQYCINHFGMHRTGVLPALRLHPVDLVDLLGRAGSLLEEHAAVGAAVAVVGEHLGVHRTRPHGVVGVLRLGGSGELLERLFELTLGVDEELAARHDELTRRLLAIEVEPGRVWLAGARSQVLRLSEVVTEPIDIGGLEASEEREARIVLGGGTVWLEENEPVTVRIQVEPDPEAIEAEAEPGAEGQADADRSDGEEEQQQAQAGQEKA